jgi:hypothetical protein
MDDAGAFTVGASETVRARARRDNVRYVSHLETLIKIALSLVNGNKKIQTILFHEQSLTVHAVDSAES